MMPMMRNALELQAGVVEMRQHRAQDLHDDDHEQHPVDGGGDPLWERLVAVEEVAGGVDEDDGSTQSRNTATA